MRRAERTGRLEEFSEFASKAQKFGMVNRMGAHVRARVCVYACVRARNWIVVR